MHERFDYFRPNFVEQSKKTSRILFPISHVFKNKTEKIHTHSTSLSSFDRDVDT